MPKKRKAAQETKPMPRSTEAQRELRVNELVGLILAGARRPNLLQYAAKSWGIETRTTDALIADATVAIHDLGAAQKAQTLEDALARRREWQFLAQSEKDYRLAFNIQQDTDKLLDFYPAERRKFEFENVSDTDIKKRADELARRIIESGSGSEEARAGADETRIAGSADRAASETS